MHTLSLVWEDLWKILVTGLALGAGLPALFAVGVRSLAYGTGGDAEEHAPGVAPAPHPLGRVLAGLCFAVVLLVVVLGIVVIVASGFGQEVSFDSIYPTIQDK
ncbi:hypothetical protein KIH74_12070 [Kineosporia sp. J2-2]|uniref:Uncharacterized protein n=1 Tax=Kineosporia corallincola TaxID=2835133 RepID=A0ABS5TGZ9_9ACTN|nr:hypothetical protein [Kineosporia corallincola]MBT0769664.1 hypothetical protein [Kineosporia corallincola]